MRSGDFGNLVSRSSISMAGCRIRREAWLIVVYFVIYYDIMTLKHFVCDA